MTEDELREIEARHQPTTDYAGSGMPLLCLACAAWPCDAARLVEAYRARPTFPWTMAAIRAQNEEIRELRTERDRLRKALMEAEGAASARETDLRAAALAGEEQA